MHMTQDSTMAFCSFSTKSQLILLKKNSNNNNNKEKKNQTLGVGVIVQWLRELTAPTEDPDLISSTHLVAQNYL